MNYLCNRCGRPSYGFFCISIRSNYIVASPVIRSIGASVLKSPFGKIWDKSYYDHICMKCFFNHDYEVDEYEHVYEKRLIIRMIRHMETYENMKLHRYKNSVWNDFRLRRFYRKAYRYSFFHMTMHMFGGMITVCHMYEP